MRFTHFFRGKLGKEEVSSAFLAMILEGDQKFRRHFFKLILPIEADTLTERKWNIAVEEQLVDIKMSCGDTIVLIENKVAKGAKQHGQLRRYYLREKKENPRSRIIAIYLAPGKIGDGEVSLVKSSPEFKNSKEDYVKHILWKKLIEYPSSNNAFYPFIRSGLDEVKRVIEEARQGKYGDREFLKKIVDEAFNMLKKNSNDIFWRWSGRNEAIITKNTNLTMRLALDFELEEEPPFAPLNIRDNKNNILITIRTQFKLSAKGKKLPGLKQWWSQLKQTKIFDVPGIGPHHLQDDEWFVHCKPFSGTEDDFIRALEETGNALLTTLSGSLSSAGFQINCR